MTVQTEARAARRWYRLVGDIQFLEWTHGNVHTWPKSAQRRCRELYRQLAQADRVREDYFYAR